MLDAPESLGAFASQCVLRAEWQIEVAPAHLAWRAAGVVVSDVEVLRVSTSKGDVADSHRLKVRANPALGTIKSLETAPGLRLTESTRITDSVWITTLHVPHTSRRSDLSLVVEVGESKERVSLDVLLAGFDGTAMTR